MAPRNAIRSFLSLLLMIPMMLLTGLAACSKSKNSGGTAAALAPIQGESDANASGSDADSKDGSTSLEDCDKDEGVESEGDSGEDDYADEESAALKADKAQKGKKGKKECPVPGTAPATTGGTASLADGQKLYAANCQGCHGALPGEQQGSSAASILSASGVGAHKGVSPWPAGAGSALSAQDAAASLAAAMK
ncbi:MAG TPA: hypothetical protein VFO10_28035 [Oligoflexus sp.]|uniref:c-type cytochrome n=1 Tax=Oligoflexus sp. TaxID=1971216 RepID=UPI002D7E7F29|nr:hypothetical protein [Oligoflexus sp.]HET9241148.1 hypothetical protein [Oligoflexus sp.]